MKTGEGTILDICSWITATHNWIYYIKNIQENGIRCLRM